MVSRRERAEFWPDDLTLLYAHRAQARGILRLLQNDAWKEQPAADKLRVVGNYMLLSSFITADIDKSYARAGRIGREKNHYILGMIVAGFTIPSAVDNAEKIYSTNLRTKIYPLLHIPEGSPELIESRRNGKVVCTALDVAVLCEQAHILAEQTEDN